MNAWIIAIIVAIPVGFLIEIFFKPPLRRIWQWFARKIADSIKKGLGMQELNEKIDKLQKTVDYLRSEKSQMKGRITKLEKISHDTTETSSKTKDDKD